MTPETKMGINFHNLEKITELPEGAKYLVMVDGKAKWCTQSPEPSEPSEPSIIHFTVGAHDDVDYDTGEYIYNTYECTAEEGMTWGEWVNSDYNTVGAYETDGYVEISDMYSGSQPLGNFDEVIVDGNHYGS